MKTASKIGLLVLLLSCFSFARQGASGFCQNGGVTIVTQGLNSTNLAQGSFPGCTVTVFTHGVFSPLPNIFSDNSGTPLSNPFTASLTNGSWIFYADNARYDVVLSGGGMPSPVTISDILLNDSVQQPSVLCSALTFSSSLIFNVSACGSFPPLTLTGNVSSSSIIGAIQGQIINFSFCQDGTGGRTLTWPVTFVSPPTLVPLANKCQQFSFQLQSDSNWHNLSEGEQYVISNLWVPEGSCPSGVTGFDLLCGDSTAHAFKSCLNGGTCTLLPQLSGDLGGTATTPTVVSTHISGITNNLLMKANSTGNMVNSSISDNGTTVSTSENVSLTGTANTVGTSSGVNSLPGSNQFKSDPWFDVRQYGVNVCTGSDDATAIQATITAAQAAGRASRVIFPDGCKFGSQLTYSNGVSFEGLGSGPWISGPTLTYTGTATPAIKCSNASGCLGGGIRNLAITYTNAGFSGVLFSNTGSNGGFMTIDGAALFSSLTGASYLMDITNSVNNHITRSWFGGTQNGINANGAFGVTIEGNIFQSIAGQITGKYIDASSSGCQGCTISSNNFELISSSNTAGPLLDCTFGCFGSKFTGNSIFDMPTTWTGTAVKGCAGLLIGGNAFVGPVAGAGGTVAACVGGSNGFSFKGNAILNNWANAFTGLGSILTLDISGNTYGSGITTFSTGTPTSGIIGDPTGLTTFFGTVAGSQAGFGAGGSLASFVAKANNFPDYGYVVTGAAAHNKVVDMLATSTGWQVRFLEDDNSTSVQAISCGRSGVVATGCGIAGTNTNDGAAAGFDGELISSVVATGSSISLVTATTANITSVSLTAGDWDCRGAVDFTFGASTSYTALTGGVSTTSATLGAQDSGFSFVTPAAVPTASPRDMTWAVPVVRESLASTTTVFLVTQATFTVSTLKAYGTLQCRRVR